MLRLPLSTQWRLACRLSSLNTCKSTLLQHSPRNPTRLREYSVHALESPDQLEEIEDFGNYSIILPPEPFVFGVSHIKPRQVPDGIIKPPYVHNNGNETLEGANKPESIVELGGEAELRLRNAAKLAKKVREYAGSLVKVSFFLMFFILR